MNPRTESNEFASCSNDNTIKIWNVYSYQEVATLEGHENNVNYIEYTSDSQKLISCSDDKTIRIWNCDTY